jgi:hypothetical protein
MMHEHSRHPIAIPATAMFSPASPGKGYLARMGIQPRLMCEPRFSRRVLGLTFTSYSAGRVECRCRCVVLEVTYLDSIFGVVKKSVTAAPPEIHCASWPAPSAQGGFSGLSAARVR